MLEYRLCLSFQLLDIERLVFAVLIQHATVADGEPDVVGVDRERERLVGVVHRYVVYRVKIDQYEVGMAAGFELAAVISYLRERARALRESADCVGRDYVGRKVNALVQQRGELKLAQNRQLIVRRRAVSAESDVDICVEQLLERRDSARELEIADRIVRDIDAQLT